MASLGSRILALALALSPTLAVAQAEANGTFKIAYEAPADDTWKPHASWVKEMNVFDMLASGITETIYLPKDLNGVFRNCGEVNAFYDPAKREIVMCYELLEMLVDTASKNGIKHEDNGQFVIGGALFFFLHETGHALVDQLDLPITGKEEDAVDEIATLILLAGDEEDGTSDGATLVAHAAAQFREMAAAKQSMTELDLWDEHSLDAQRMYGILCLIYGANPKANAAMVGDHSLPAARAQQCPADYKKRQRAWERLLENSFKPDPEEPPATG